MSVVTEMVVITEKDDAAMAALNAWCARNDPARGQQFARLDADAAGGAKFYTAEVWAMAGNYFPWGDLARAFTSFGWMMPERAMLIVSAEDSDGLRTYRADQL